MKNIPCVSSLIFFFLLTLLIFIQFNFILDILIFFLTISIQNWKIITELFCLKEYYKKSVFNVFLICQKNKRKLKLKFFLSIVIK